MSQFRHKCHVKLLSNWLFFIPFRDRIPEFFQTHHRGSLLFVVRSSLPKMRRLSASFFLLRRCFRYWIWSVCLPFLSCVQPQIHDLAWSTGSTDSVSSSLRLGLPAKTLESGISVYIPVIITYRCHVTHVTLKTESGSAVELPVQSVQAFAGPEPQSRLRL